VFKGNQSTYSLLIANKWSTGDGGKHKIILVNPNFCLFKNIDSGFGFGYLKIFKLVSVSYGSQYFKGFWVPEPVVFGSVVVPGRKYKIS